MLHDGILFQLFEYAQGLFLFAEHIHGVAYVYLIFGHAVVAADSFKEVVAFAVVFQSLVALAQLLQCGSYGDRNLGGIEVGVSLREECLLLLVYPVGIGPFSIVSFDVALQETKSGEVVWVLGRIDAGKCQP